MRSLLHSLLFKRLHHASILQLPRTATPTLSHPIGTAHFTSVISPAGNKRTFSPLSLSASRSGLGSSSGNTSSSSSNASSSRTMVTKDDVAQGVQQAGAMLGLTRPPHAIEPAGAQGSSYARFPHTGTLPADPSQRRPPGLVHNVWNMQSQRQQYPTLDSDITTDVLVVGGGITGLAIAYNLAKAGKDVTVVEARVRGAGQTGRTSAHIMQWNDDFYHTLESKFGTDGVRLIGESHVAAVDFIERVCKEENIVCDFTRLPGYLFPHKEEQSESSNLDKELAACQRAGMLDVAMVDLKGDPRHGGLKKALKFPHSAEFHPLKYINGLAAAITRHGGKVYESTRVKDTLAPQLDGVVTTNTGHKVTAREAIVYATNSPINRNLAVHARQEAKRTYMIGFKVPKGSVERANWWSTEENYHYIRIQPGDMDGTADYDVLLVGGEDHQTGMYPNKYTDSWAALEDFTRTRWKQAGEVLYRWSGQVYEPIDQLGLYGSDPLNPVNATSSVKRYIATGDSGQGMTGSHIAAMVIGDQILGRHNPWTDIYSPSRVKSLPYPSTLQEFASEAMVTCRGYLDNIALRSLQDLRGLMGARTTEELKPGEGAVVQQGVAKVAVYKDMDGKVSRRSALCPHVGCLVEWNPADATFDCPCHGSQFDCHGNCFNGPANNNLKELF